ncbi:MAG: hypothetical protein HYY65_02900 [Candidatus Tectomicrobia bacterium]|uniref:Uncharacterized protein n=1 Tax=Tectimicrobiota bacterium TaxID=2528274 RepID=A0A932LZ66_UNCTE|nr:hypothetical protein [Candidatus Tectomicrobia bacterium]
MDTQTKTRIEADLTSLRHRVGAETGIRHELVRIQLEALLEGQEAVHYQVSRIFAKELSDQAFINLVFRLGLKNTIELIRAIALQNGITL